MLVKPYKHISFDLDGTLIHTLPEYRYKVVSGVVSQLGGNILNTKSIDKFWFEAGRDEIIQKEFCVQPESFWELFELADSADERSLYTHPYQDVELVFNQLKNLGKTISIITGSSEWITRMEIKKLQTAPHDYYFSIKGQGFKPKPNPESFHIVLNRLNHQPHETLYIGNSNEDAFFAKNCGADFIYIERNEYQFDHQDWITKTIYSLEELF